MTGDHDVLVRVFRVFTDDRGRHGNALGVIDGALVAARDRQRVARRARLQRDGLHRRSRHRRAENLHTECRASPCRSPARRGGLAPVPPPGVGGAIDLRPPGGLVHAWTGEDSRTWIEAPLVTLPDWTLVQLGSPAEVEDLVGPLRAEHDHVVYWAWVDSGLMRVRCFAPRFGITEDEATGSAALRLAAMLNRPIEIRQGRGSRLSSRPVDADTAAVGGLVVEDEPRHLN